MAKELALTAAEYSALAAIDGTRKQPRTPPEIKVRLTDLRLVERREWPNGPLWRTTAGNRLVQARK